MVFAINNLASKRMIKDVGFRISNFQLTTGASFKSPIFLPMPTANLGLLGRDTIGLIDIIGNIVNRACLGWDWRGGGRTVLAHTLVRGNEHPSSR